MLFRVTVQLLTVGVRKVWVTGDESVRERNR